MGRKSREIKKEIKDLNNILTLPDLTDMYKTHHWTMA